MREVKLFLLGIPRIELEGVAVNIPERKAVALLAYLAVSGVRHSRDELATLLWSDQSQASARASLRHVLWSVKTGGLGSLLAVGREEISLDPTYWLDVKALRQHIASYRQHGHNAGIACAGCVPALQAAVELYTAEFMAGFTLRDAPLFDEWQYFQREECNQLLALALRCLVDWHARLGEWEQAIAAARHWVTLEPLHEPAQRELMRLYARNDQRALAQRQYQTLRARLQEELGLEPEAETTDLMQAIRAGVLEISSGEVLFSALEPAALRLRTPAFLEGGAPQGQASRGFFAREAELKLLQGQLNEALAGESRMTFIQGEAGSGKTSLLAEFARRAEAAYPELICLRGSCNAYFGSGDPYLPFREMLAMLSGDVENRCAAGELSLEMARRIWQGLPSFLSILLDRGEDLVDVFVPGKALISRLSEYANASSPWLEKLNRTIDRQKQVRDSLVPPRLIDELTVVLKTFSMQQPLLLMMDDLQWIDTPSVSLLFHLGRRMQPSRILVIGAFRTSEIAIDRPDALTGEAQQHPLEPLINELQSAFGAMLVDLEQAEVHEGAKFVDELLDSEPNRLSKDFRLALFERTSGHPLFTIELLHDLQERGYLARDEGGDWVVAQELDWQSLPGRVEVVISQRLRRLEPGLLEVLSTASVEGEQFTAQVIAPVLGIAERDVLIRLRRLEKLYKLVVEQGELPAGGLHLSRYRFSHALFQEYLYRQLNQGERRMLHRLIADRLEEIYTFDHEGILHELAQHYSLAEEWQKAAPYLVKAGYQAFRRGALGEAVKAYRQGLAYLPSADLAGRALALRWLGECLEVIGDLPETMVALQEANKLYIKLNDRQSAGAVQRLIGMAYYTRTARHQGLHLLHQALAILEEEVESEELARVVSEIARTHMLASQYDQATAWGERAFKLAHDLGVEDVLVHSMTTLGVTYMSLGDVNRGLPMLQESLLRALDLGLVSNICRAYVNLGNILMAYARYPEAQEAWQALLSYATRIQSPAYAEIAMIYSSWIDWLTGKWQVAIERSWSLVESILHESTPQPLDWKIWTATLTGQMFNDLSQPEKVCLFLERWMPLARQDTELQGFLPYLSELLVAYIASGKDDQADSIFQECLEWFERSPYFYVNCIQLIPTACHWLARRGDRYADKIQTCIRWLEKGDQQFHTAETAACVHEAWGCLLLAQSDDHGAGERFKQAAARWGEIQRPYDQLRAWNGLIPILHRQHQDAEEQEMLFQARQVVHSLASQLVDPEMKASLLRRFSAMGILA